MDDKLSARQVIDALGLEPNQTCGFVTPTYSSALVAEGLPAPFEASRPAGSALYFLVTPQAPVQLHRIQNDQLYHYYLGDPLEVVMLLPDGTVELATVGPHILEGDRLQLLIPGGTFHTARTTGEGSWFLGGSTEWPGVIPADVELGDAAELGERYPSALREIHTFPMPVEPKPTA